MASFKSLSTVSYSHSIVTMALSCIISKIKRDIGQKSRFLIPLHLTTLLGGSSSELWHTVWYGKTRIVWLPSGEKSLICLAISTEYRHVADRQTDRHLTIAWSVLCIASCSNVGQSLETVPPHQRLKHWFSKVEDVVANGIVVLETEWRQDNSVADRECQPHVVDRLFLQHCRHSTTSWTHLAVQHHRLHVSTNATWWRPVGRRHAGKGRVRRRNSCRWSVCWRNSLHWPVWRRNSPRCHCWRYFGGIARHHWRQLLTTTIHLVLHMKPTNVTHKKSCKSLFHYISMDSLTHCCAWLAEGRSYRHNEWSWFVIWVRPTDILQFSSTCCSHVLLGRPGGRFQCAVGGVMPVWASIDSCNACEASVFLGRRQTWPNNEWRLSPMRDGRSGNFVLSQTAASESMSYQFMPRIRRSACVWKDWILLLSTLCVVDVSEPYNTIDCT